MILNKRTNCIINPHEEIEKFYTFKNFPILMSTVDDQTLIDNDKFLDMDWGISPSGNIQLINLLDPTVIYNEYHTSGSSGKIWQDHHKKLFEFVSQSEYHNLLEVGGSSGHLASNFCTSSKEFSYTIIEPNLTQKAINDSRVHLINGFFENYNFDKKYDTVVHSHCFEHVYDPIQFLHKVNQLLTDNGVHYISIPNMRYWLEHKSTNVLSFEHTFYVDDFVLEYLLNSTGFEIIEKISNPHSIYVKSIKSSSIKVKPTTFSYVKNLFNNYIQELQQDVELIKQQLGNKEFYLFGAHIFSQFYFNLGINQNQVKYILDNDPKKQQRRLYGTSCYVRSPMILKDIENPIVVVRAGPYTDEIKDAILKINDKTFFI